MQVGFIGTGRIAQRLVGALTKATGEHRITVTRRSRSISSELAAQHPEVTVEDDPQAVLDASEVVFLCLPPDGVSDTLANLRFSADHALVSVMNGVSLDALQPLVRPATDLSVTIPLPFVETGGCPLPVYPDTHAVRALLGSNNPIIPVDSEAAMAPFWVATGTLASVMSELDETSRWLGQRIGDEEAAERYVGALYTGYLSALPDTGPGRFRQAVEDLGTPGGFNARMLAALDGNGDLQRWRALLDHLYGGRRDEP